MSEVFGEPYAAVYDALYRDKDYTAECELIRDVFAVHARQPIRSILDLGCGSGNHLQPLKAMGFDVEGVDRSMGMLVRAREKVDVPLHCSDIRDCLLGRRFDAVLMMFAVLGYQIENQDVQQALRTVRRHLDSGGLFLFDCWYGPAVLHEKPSNRVKHIETAQGPLQRTASTTLDVRRQTCDVTFQIHRNGQETFEERHPVRFFFPREIELLLESAGLRLLHLGAFPDWPREPSVTDWNVLGIAVAE